MSKNLEKLFYNLREGSADTFGNISYPLVVGTALDAASGLNLGGILTSRISSLPLNAFTGVPYGKWRNFIFQKTEKLRKDQKVKKILKQTITIGGKALASLIGTPSQGYSEIANYLVDTKKLQDTSAELFAFNTFQVPLYAGLVGIGSLVSEGKIDLNKVINGATYAATLSPFIGPTMGWYMDGLRKIFKTKPAAEKADRNK